MEDPAAFEAVSAACPRAAAWLGLEEELAEAPLPFTGGAFAGGDLSKNLSFGKRRMVCVSVSTSSGRSTRRPSLVTKMGGRVTSYVPSSIAAWVTCEVV